MKAVVLMAAVLCSAAVVSQATEASTTRASLRLVDETSPSVLRGKGFQPREHVKIVIVAETRLVRTRIATVRGTFSVRVPEGWADSCQGFSAVAVGNHGSRATLKRAPGQCPQP